MTNAEKFKEDWGFEPNVTHCPKCGRESCMVCTYAEKRFEECASDWWNSEYQGTPTIPLSVIDKITTEIVELTKCPYGTECLGANCPTNTDCMICGEHVLDIIDEAVKECTHEV